MLVVAAILASAALVVGLERRLPVPGALVLLAAGMAGALVPHPAPTTHAAQGLANVGLFVVLAVVGEEIAELGAHPLAADGLRIAGLAGALTTLCLLVVLGTLRALNTFATPSVLVALALAALPTSSPIAVATLERAPLPPSTRRLVLQAAVAEDFVSLLVLALLPLLVPSVREPTRTLLVTAVAVIVALVARRTTTGGLRALAAVTVTASMLLGTSPALAGALAGALAHDLLPHHGLVVWVRRVLAAAFFGAAGFVGGSLEPLTSIGAHTLLATAAVLAAIAVASLGVWYRTRTLGPWIALGLVPRGSVNLALAAALAPLLGPRGGSVVLVVVLGSATTAAAWVAWLSRRAGRSG